VKDTEMDPTQDMQDMPPAGPAPAPGMPPEGPMPRGATPEGDPPAEGGAAVTAQAREQLEAHIPPELQSAVERLVLAGRKAMFSQQTNELAMAEVEKHPEGPGAGAAVGVAALMSQLLGRVKGSMPAPAIVPAALILLMDALEFLDEGGVLQATPEVVSDATEDLAAYLMQKFGLTPDKVQEAQQLMQEGVAAREGGGAPAAAGPGPAAPPGPPMPGSGAPPAGQRGLIGQAMRG
jgi:hypothetical protein